MGYGYNQPPFKRGTTLFNKPASDTSLSTSDGAEIEGQIWEFPDVNPSTGAVRSNNRVVCRAVRWTGTGGIARPRYCCVLDSDRGTNGLTAVAGAIGMARSANLSRHGFGATSGALPAKCYPIDEYLPSAGVATNDIMWVVIEGPAEVVTSAAAMTGAVAVGDLLVAATAGASAATSTGITGGGKIDVITNSGTTASTDVGGPAASRVIGRALSAATTSELNANLLCYVGLRS